MRDPKCGGKATSVAAENLFCIVADLPQCGHKNMPYARSVGKPFRAKAMLGWVNLDREEIREVARILVPGILGAGFALLLIPM
jgi:hypothetical protein